MSYKYGIFCYQHGNCELLTCNLWATNRQILSYQPATFELRTWQLWATNLRFVSCCHASCELLTCKLWATNMQIVSCCVCVGAPDPPDGVCGQPKLLHHRDSLGKDKLFLSFYINHFRKCHSVPFDIFRFKRSVLKLTFYAVSKISTYWGQNAMINCRIWIRIE